MGTPRMGACGLRRDRAVPLQGFGEAVPRCAEYGLDSATAFRAIHGIGNPTAATIVALSDLFAVDAGKLLEGLEVE